MHDKRDTIIYVGKARSLRHRVRQYFQPSHDEGIKKAQMVRQIASFEYIVTDSELEALVLECNLIKEYRPKYNTMLRDDKTYPYIKVTLGEPYPRVLFSRTLRKDKSRYFGPYTSAGAVKDTIELIQKIFHLRTCSQHFPEAFGKTRPCLNYHMKQCQGVCTGKISQEEYQKNVEGALDFLNGNYRPVIDMLQEKMEQAAKELEFEKAAGYRDLIGSVKACAQRQKMTHMDGEDKDIVALAQSGEDAVVQVFFVRNGKLIGREHFFMNVKVEDQTSELLERFLQQFYSGTPVIPREIFLQEDIENPEVLEQWLSSRRGARAYLRIPRKGMKEKLVELAKKNARMVLDQDRERIKKEEGRTIGALKEIADLLHMDRIERMEAYDISNINGFQTVGSMVVFEKGKPLRSDYRKFKLRTVSGPDDYGSMREVIGRRLQEYFANKDSGEGFGRLPDLILLDGGKGHVAAVKPILEASGLDIALFGMVKDDKHRTRAIAEDGGEIAINSNRKAFTLVSSIQEEVHRFAIGYHRQTRKKNTLTTTLTEIEGIGETRARALLRHFRTLTAIRQADLAELETAPGMTKPAARKVYEYFHGEESPEMP